MTARSRSSGSIRDRGPRRQSPRELVHAARAWSASSGRGSSRSQRHAVATSSCELREPSHHHVDDGRPGGRCTRGRAGPVARSSSGSRSVASPPDLVAARRHRRRAATTAPCRRGRYVRWCFAGGRAPRRWSRPSALRKHSGRAAERGQRVRSRVVGRTAQTPRHAAAPCFAVTACTSRAITCSASTTFPWRSNAKAVSRVTFGNPTRTPSRRPPGRARRRRRTTRPAARRGRTTSAASRSRPATPPRPRAPHGAGRPTAGTARRGGTRHLTDVGGAIVPTVHSSSQSCGRPRRPRRPVRAPYRPRRRRAACRSGRRCCGRPSEPAVALGREAGIEPVRDQVAELLRPQAVEGRAGHPFQK